MGAQQSIASSENYANLSANTNVAVNESCSAQQSILAQPETIVIGTIKCDDQQIGNVTVAQQATCQNQQQVSILSKVVADQTANSIARNQFPSSLFSQAIAESSNFVDVQNNVAAIMQSTCNNAQNVTVGKRSLNVGAITGKTCDIFNTDITQNSICLQNIQADITNSTETNQTATATASNGIDLGQLLALLLVLLLFIVLIILVVPLGIFGGLGKFITGTASGSVKVAGLSVKEAAGVL
jgi:hypothetical protein